jgi:hypothetical protein
MMKLTLIVLLSRFLLQTATGLLALNQWMKEYAATEGIGYLGYYSAIVNDQHGLKAEFSDVDVHPNAAGYIIMARLVADAIARLKLRPPKKSPQTPMRSSLYL